MCYFSTENLLTPICYFIMTSEYQDQMNMDKMIHDVAKGDKKMINDLTNLMNYGLMNKFLETVYNEMTVSKMIPGAMEFFGEKMNINDGIKLIQQEIETDVFLNIKKKGNKFDFKMIIDNGPISFNSINGVPVHIRGKYVKIDFKFIEKTILLGLNKEVSIDNHPPYVGFVRYLMGLFKSIHIKDIRKNEVIEGKNISYLAYMAYNYNTHEIQEFTFSPTMDCSEIYFYINE